MNKKNLILTAIVNYRWEDIEPFFVSMEIANFCNCECIVFCYNIEKYTRRMLEQKGVNLIDMDFKEEQCKGYSINDTRYKCYSEYLGKNHDNYNKVLLTDARDVIFQKDVFSYSWEENAICLALESLKIGEEFWNKKWIIRKYGNNVFMEMKDKQIVCSGTILGSVGLVEKLAERLYKQIMTGTYFPIQDQGDLNYLVHKDELKLPVQTSDNFSGAIITVGTESKVNVKENKILNHKGDVAFVVHQYDRKKELVKLVDSLYSSSIMNIMKRHVKKYRAGRVLLKIYSFLNEL